MRHHTKDKGDIGVLHAQVDLAQQGYTILIPLTEHSDFDIVAYKDNEFLRIQVKYRSLSKNGTVYVPFVSTWSDRNGIHSQAIEKENIDYICIYCPETKECYYINPKEFFKSVTLRIHSSKNSQKKRVHLAKNFVRIRRGHTRCT